MRIIVLIVFMFFSVMHLTAQTDASASKKVKKAEQKMEQQKRNQQKAEVKGVKRHESIQTKATRKRMKKHRKQRIHVDAYESKPFFMKRWFQKKER